jgi:two-component system sensor histidine kinase PilS (NtrC family)
MEEISGSSFSEVENKAIDRVIAGFSETLDKMKSEKGEGGPIERGEIVVSGKQGRDIMLGFSLSSLMDSRDNKIGDIAIFQDLTATKEMEKEVEKSKNLALIGEMAAGLAHEIRNPLTAMIGSIQLLEKNLNLDETDERLMRIVVRGRDQIENLIGNFLLLARPNLTDREEIDINDVMEDVLEALRCGPEWHENIQVEKVSYGGAGIYGNRTELKQMLWNLVLNAVQSMPDGGVLKIVSRASTSDNGDEYLGISISDTGCGIEKDRESRIFTPFYTTKERGTGLGLAIATRVVESHGGRIEIESEVGTGTICNVLLPLSGESMGQEKGQ